MDDKHVREFQRMDGSVMAFQGRLIHGPYTQDYRATLLRELLKVHREYSSHRKVMSLCSRSSVRPRCKRYDVSGWSRRKRSRTLAAQIYQEVLGQELPSLDEGSSRFFTSAEIELLKGICDEVYPEDQNLVALLRKIPSLEEEVELNAAGRG